MTDDRWTQLFARYKALSEPKLRARDAAERLGVSEAELVAAKSAPGWSRPLQLDSERGFAPLLEDLPKVGEVMVLTRNDHAVHERHGQFGNVEIGKVMGIVVNHEIDLRLFMNHWRFGFEVEERMASGMRRSLQFFDGTGSAVHKIYTTEATNLAAFDELVSNWAATAAPEIDVVPAEPPLPDRPDHEINVEGLRYEWLKMRDTHEFFGLLKRNKVGRLQALRLVGKDLAFRADPSTLARILEGASTKGTPIMVFVRNRGCIQIHTGPVHKIAPMGPWINVMDPEFNLHLRTDRIDTAWIVRKPTSDGTVTSFEVFDADGDCFAMFFGERKPGKPELPAWRNLLEEMVLEATA